MPFEICWYKENYVIMIQFTGDVSEEELKQSVEEELKLIENSPHETVHVLIDARQQTSHPTDFLTLARILNPVLEHPKKGWTLEYGRKGKFMARLAISAVARLQRSKYRTFDTLEEAMSYLLEVDPTLRDIFS